MSIDFDPFHKWLGIPPKDQPPHYYRLLGIEAFESDPEVITIAADQRLQLLRTFQNGPNALISQKLQKKISAAKACLLNPEKKHEYDVSLKLHFRAQASKAPPSHTPLSSLHQTPPPHQTPP
ncbi:MAG: hypothetical protein ACWGMZ_05245, partial [Thermoguttaceae bacterium]